MGAWRLPTLSELQSIVATDADPCATVPCVADPLFSPTQSSYYCSSSTFQDDPTVAWLVGFVYGGTDNEFGKTYGTHVRGVRAGS